SRDAARSMPASRSTRCLAIAPIPSSIAWRTAICSTSSAATGAGAGNVGVKFLVARSAPGRATAPAHLEVVFDLGAALGTPPHALPWRERYHERGERRQPKPRWVPKPAG